MDGRAPRRSARTRSESAEPRDTAPATKSRKQPELPTIQQSPAGRSSVAPSGTPARSIAAPSGLDEAAEALVDGLRPLWDISSQLLNTVLPKEITLKSLEELHQRLENSPRQNKNLQKQIEALSDAIAIYPQKPIDVAQVNAIIFPIREADQLQEGPHRPDDILYRANLVSALAIVVNDWLGGLHDFDSSLMLQVFEQSLFSKVVKHREVPICGSTSHVKSTFELALELRTQSYIAAVTDSEDSQDFDAREELLDYFSVNHKPRGWDVSGLRTEELTKPQLDAIRQRSERLSEHVRDSQGDLSSAELQAAFPIMHLIPKFFIWAHQRNEELVLKVENENGGPLAIAEAIDNEVTRIQQQHTGINTTRFPGNANFAIPNKPIKSKATKKAGIYDTLQANLNPSRPPMSAAGSAVTAATHELGSYHPHGSVEEDDNVIDGNIFVGDEGGEDPAAQQQNTFDGTQLDPAMLATYVMEADKENYPDARYPALQRSLLDAQSQAQQVPWHPNPEPRVDKGKRRQDVAEENIGTQQDDDTLSQDEGFETQAAPTEGPNKRRRQNPGPPQNGTISHVPMHGYTQGSTAIEEQQAQPPQFHSLRTEAYSRANAEAKEVSRQHRAFVAVPKAPQTRKPWNGQEIDRLLELVAEIGTSWAAIKKTDEADGNILEFRDQVALKDKARNIKMDYLKSGQPLPMNFIHVALKTADTKKLLAMGIEVPSVVGFQGDTGVQDNGFDG